MIDHNLLADNIVIFISDKCHIQIEYCKQNDDLFIVNILVNIFTYFAKQPFFSMHFVCIETTTAAFLS